jgi:TonB family protein
MRNEKILVVEFEENTLNSLLQFLQTKGFQVVTAKDGHEGLLKYESESPDLVILEPMLLKLHGFDLCRKISKDSNKKTPVIITTGFYKGEHYKLEAMQTFGASAFFEKPYENDELFSAINDLLKNGTEQSVTTIQENLEQAEEEAGQEQKKVPEKKKSTQEQETQAKKAADKPKKMTKIDEEVDDLLKDTLSEFGLSLDKKKPPSPKKTESEDKAALPKKPEESQKFDEAEQAKELKPERLIEELIRKEDELKEEEKVDKEEEKEEEEKKEAEILENKEKESKRTIFEEYFDRPTKTPFYMTILKAIKKIRKPIPLIISSAAFVVVIATGATVYFLKSSGNPVQTANQQSKPILSSVQGTAPGIQNPDSAGQTPSGQQTPEKSPGEAGSSSGEAGDTTEIRTSADQTMGKDNQPDSVSEFMSTTWLSSAKREVMLPSTTSTPEVREFEVVEVEEAKDTHVGLEDLDIRTPFLEDTAKKIIQPDNVSERIKTGDLVPIESVDVQPVATRKINPEYPKVAYERGIEANVMIKVLISEFGNVLDVTFVGAGNTPTAFEKVCEETVRKWKFRPATKDGMNVKVWKTFSIIFKKNKTE